MKLRNENRSSYTIKGYVPKGYHSSSKTGIVLGVIFAILPTLYHLFLGDREYLAANTTEVLTNSLVIFIVPVIISLAIDLKKKTKWYYSIEKMFNLNKSLRVELEKIVGVHCDLGDDDHTNKYGLEKIKEKYETFFGALRDYSKKHSIKYEGSNALDIDLELVSSNWKELKAVTYLDSEEKCKLDEFKKRYLKRQKKVLEKGSGDRITRIYLLDEKMLKNDKPKKSVYERMYNEQEIISNSTKKIDVRWLVCDKDRGHSDRKDFLLVDNKIISISNLTPGYMSEITLSWDSYDIQKYNKLFDKLAKDAIVLNKNKV